MTDNLNEAINRCRSAADNASYQLIDIADALARVGMGDMARELTFIANKIVVGPKDVSGAYGLELNSQLRHSEAMMGSLLKATLEGCIVGPRKAAEGRTP